MIVRISARGSTDLDDGLHARLNELDDAVVAAVDAGDEAAFHAAFEELLRFVRAEGAAPRRRRPRGVGLHPAAGRHSRSRRPARTSPARA